MATRRKKGYSTMIDTQLLPDSSPDSSVQSTEEPPLQIYEPSESFELPSNEVSLEVEYIEPEEEEIPVSLNAEVTKVLASPKKNQTRVRPPALPKRTPPRNIPRFF